MAARERDQREFWGNKLMYGAGPGPEARCAAAYPPQVI
jgi:hypothetical protein